MSHVPLVRSLKLRNFLSYGPEAVTVDLLPLNVLIGPNASGKSNLVESFGVLRAATRDLAAPFREDGIAEWLWKGPSADRVSPVAELQVVLAQPGTDMGFRYDLSLTEVAHRTQLVDEFIENESPSPGNTTPFFHYRYQNGHPVLSTVDTQREEMSSSLEQSRELSRKWRKLKREDLLPDQSVLSQRNDPAFYPEISYVAKQLGAIAIHRLWDTGPSSPIRTPSRADDFKTRLADDAGNLALVLNNLLTHSHIRRLLLDQLGSFFDRAEDIHFEIYANTVQLGIREAGTNTPIPAGRLSDGTLRFLGLLAILCEPSPPPLICIEEPELGMHPDVIPTIAQMLIEASTRSQLIVTTHSDMLVSALGSQPESVVVCEHDGCTSHLTRLDSGRLSAWLKKYSLGELWLKGQIGGTRW